jgi:hypothetical protein
MKITKRQLRRIIREEKARLVEEALPVDLYRQLNAIVDNLMSAGQSADEVAAELRGIADDIEDNARRAKHPDIRDTRGRWENE